jgi:hypothetical protein
VSGQVTFCPRRCPITLGIAQVSVSVHTLDADPAMLDALRQKLANQPPEVQERVVVMVGDMRVFTLAERFALIIAPFRAFLHNLTEHDQHQSTARWLRYGQQHADLRGQVSYLNRRARGPCAPHLWNEFRQDLSI